jgi:hypothetical protein
MNSSCSEAIMSKKVNFVTIGDSAFFKTILLSAKQVSKFYPESKFFIYDWGFNKEQKKEIRFLSNTKAIL